MENKDFEKVENNEMPEEESTTIETAETGLKPKKKAKTIIIVISIILAVILALGAAATVLYLNGFFESLGKYWDNSSDNIITEGVGASKEFEHEGGESSHSKGDGQQEDASSKKVIYEEEFEHEGGGSSQNKDGGQQEDASSKDSGHNTSSNNSTSTPKNLSEQPNVTIATQVASDICVVGGICSKNTECIKISGDGISDTTVIPFAGEDQKYFMAQIKYSKSTKLSIVAKEKGKEISEPVVKALTKKALSVNYTTRGEYNAVFGKNSRMHFYSALLSYSLDTSKLTEEMKREGQNNISNIVNAANRAGAETIFYIIPSSAQIYPETVPDEYKKTSGQTLYKAFYDIATEYGAKVMYPLNTMKAHANDGEGYQLYQHTDSHWSTYGAYWGLYDLFDYISKSSKYQNAKPRTVSEMGFYTAELCGGDALFNFPKNIGFENNYTTGLTPITGIRELTTLYKLRMPTTTLPKIYHSNTGLYLTEHNANAAVVNNNRGNGLPTAVIMRDSFGKVCYDMVNDRFAKVHWGQFNNYNIPYDSIANANPDYVIYLYSERNLLKLMLGNSNASILTIR